MANLQVGVELMIIGMMVVFVVLILLLYVMKLMNVAVKSFTSRQPVPAEVQVAADTDEQELAVVLATVTGMFDDIQGNVVRIQVN